MKEEILEAISNAGVFSNEDKTQAIVRCVDVIEYLYETASKMVVSFILTQPCEKTQAFSNHPEELAIKAMGAAMRRVACGGRQPGEPVH